MLEPPLPACLPALMYFFSIRKENYPKFKLIDFFIIFDNFDNSIEISPNRIFVVNRKGFPARPRPKFFVVLGPPCWQGLKDAIVFDKIIGIPKRNHFGMGEYFINHVMHNPFG